MTKVTVKLFASLADYLPPAARNNEIELKVEDSATIGAIINQLHVPEARCHLVLKNGVFVPPGQRKSATLAEGDTLAIWPPVAGG